MNKLGGTICDCCRIVIKPYKINDEKYHICDTCKSTKSFVEVTKPTVDQIMRKIHRSIKR